MIKIYVEKSKMIILGGLLDHLPKEDSHNQKKMKPDIIEHDCKLEWKYPNLFYLIIPYKRNFSDIGYEKQNIVALDPGIRKFMTSFSERETYEFQPPPKIDRYNREIDHIKSRKRGRKGILKRTRKINNIVREFHYEIISYLTIRYKNILLPSFDSQELFGKRRVINKGSARKLNYLSHYKFKERLRHRCDLTDTKRNFSSSMSHILLKLVLDAEF